MLEQLEPVQIWFSAMFAGIVIAALVILFAEETR